MLGDVAVRGSERMAALGGLALSCVADWGCNWSGRSVARRFSSWPAPFAALTSLVTAALRRVIYNQVLDGPGIRVAFGSPAH